ncbi:MAG TPA: efflux RND transporter periplasmic adaptor subunit [Xanthomonadales bacterium]|nr:efflux RND transporter periplasmic adaptor subunit [Xanthomonadales bacterium]
MQKLVRIILPAAVIAGAIFIVMWLVDIAGNKSPEKIAESTSAILVDTIPAEENSLNLSVVSQGPVRPRTETVLVAEVPGKIVEVSKHFVAGGFFKKGEMLLQIDPSDYEAGLKRAQATLASREAQYADQKARSDQAMKDWKNLGKQGEPSDLTLRKPQLAEALAGVQSAQADLQKAERDLARTRISLPYDGLVRSKQVDVGQYVGPGTTLGVTFSIATAEIRLPLSSTDVAYLQLPSAIDIESSNRPRVLLTAESSGIKGQWEAEIIRTEGIIDEKSRVIYAVAQIIDPYAVLGESKQQELRMGTFVKAEIQGQRVENVIVLPRSVLRPDNTVLVANEQDLLEIRPVEVLRAEPQTVYISSGLMPGEHVITTSLDVPVPGMALSVSELPGDGRPLSSSENQIAGPGRQP